MSLGAYGSGSWGSRFVSLETGALGRINQGRNYVFADKNSTEHSVETLAEDLMLSLLSVLLSALWSWSQSTSFPHTDIQRA